MAGGRPTVYKPEYAGMARNACAIGATNATLAERFGVSRTTIGNWIATIPDFSDAVRKGRQVADATVVSSLFARCTGMEQKMTKVFCHRGQPVVANYTVRLPPEVGACMFWLRNRRPGQWRENRPIVDGRDRCESGRELEAASERRPGRAPNAQPSLQVVPSLKRADLLRPVADEPNDAGRPPLRRDVDPALIGPALAEIAEIPAASPGTPLLIDNAHAGGGLVGPRARLAGSIEAVHGQARSGEVGRLKGLPRVQADDGGVEPVGEIEGDCAPPCWAGSLKWSAMRREAKLAAGRDVSPSRPDRYAGRE